jgi:D-arabinose 1-dehydrogenase-like Zn-dependent alcohol dehydrogenase
MKALVLEKNKDPMMVKDFPEPQCAPHGAIVRVEGSGICRSDWHLWQGDWSWIGMEMPLPMVLGHEYAGVVEEVGKEVQSFKKGDRVVMPPNHACGTCGDCRRGSSNLCFAGGTFMGGYGRYAAVAHADFNMMRLNDEIDFVEAASLGCRYITAYHGVLDQGQLKADDSIVIYGCGGVGLSGVQIAAAAGARVIAVDLDDEKLALAKQVGAAHVINAKNTDPVAAVRELTHGGADVAVDALGIATTCRNSVMSLRKQGRHVQIGLTTQQEKGEVSLPIDMMVLSEIQFVGSASMQTTRYPAMLGMVARGKLSPKSLVKETIPLDKAFDVIQQMSKFQNIGMSVVNQF